MNTKKTGNTTRTGKVKPVTGKGSVSKSKDNASKKGKSFAEKSTKQGTGTTAPKGKTLTGKALKSKSKYVDFKNSFKKGDPLPSFNEDAVRLNKYLSNAGICSRREADVLIATGVVSVNGVIVTELGYKIGPTDVVKYDNETIKTETKRYVLLNKPKGFITSSDDPFGRKTVMSLVKNACKERVYPVGRLDKETTGLLLFTNDGDMAKKLTHPRHRSTQLFDVELDKPFNVEDKERLLKGIEMEDGTSRFEKVEFVKGSPRQLGVEIIGGKNQIVRRTFEAIGYKVVKLDRVTFSGLTKKDLPRGYYRHLTEKEVAFLKMS
jgi:23S rRNA pseudouridine2605 synthase